MKILKRIIFCALAILVAAMYSYGIWPRAIYNTDIGANSYENTGALEEGEVLTQQFVCTDNGLCGLKIKLTKLESQSIGNYEWKIEELGSKTEIAHGVIDEKSTENKEFVSSSVQERGNIELDVPKQEDSKGKEYLLTIEGTEVQENETMAVYITEKGRINSTLKLNGDNLEKASIIKVEYKRFNVETFIVFLGIVLYLVVFVKFMYKLFK